MTPRLEVHTLREWLHRVLGTLRLERRDGDLEEEIRMHQELAAEDAGRRGLAPQEALRAARIRAGGASQAMDAARDQRGVPWFDDIARDVRHGMRTLRRSPAFTAVALLTLALGIGANAAIYQIVDAIRLRPLPVKDPEQIATIELADLTRWKGRRTSGYPVLTNPLWEQFRDQQRTFAGVLAWSNVPLRLDGNGGPGSARGLFVSGAFFKVLGVEPWLGRVFTAADDHAGCGVPGTVVSYGFWQRRLGGDRAAIGTTVALNGRSVEVIGVTPRGFSGLEVGRSYDVAVPICAQDVLGTERGWLQSGSTWWLTVMGRLASHRSFETVNAQLAATSHALFETVPPEYPATEVASYRSLRLRAVPAGTGVSALRSRYGDPLLILLVTSSLVLLIACSNLANLILARASARERELAVRLAIGASWSRLVRQLMIENALLAVAGAAAGVICASLLSRFLVGFLGSELSLELPVDARVIAFAMMLAALTCLTFGLIPAWRASRVAAHDATKAGARSVAGSREGGMLRRVLVVSQVALSLVLLCGALLFAGTLRNLLTVDAGFEPGGVTVARVDFSRIRLPQEGRAAVTGAVLDRIRGVPGVNAAAEVRHVPLGGTGGSIDVWRENADPASAVAVRLNATSDGYLETMGMRLLSGRDFSFRDSGTAPNVAIVNQAFARRLGLSGNPVGERFRGASNEVFEVIGLVPDSKYFTLREDFLPIAFVPIAQITDRRLFADFMIRSTPPQGDSTLPPGHEWLALRAAVAEVSPAIGIELRTLESSIRDGLVRERLMATLSGVFGALAALIAAIGLYGVMSYLVLRRTNEIGVRIALGARRSDIAVMVLREAGTLLAIGLAVGSLLAFAAASSVESLVFGVPPHDIRPVGLACVLLATAAIAASSLPARRAARLEPLTALREN